MEQVDSIYFITEWNSFIHSVLNTHIMWTRLPQIILLLCFYASLKIAPFYIPQSIHSVSWIIKLSLSVLNWKAPIIIKRHQMKCYYKEMLPLSAVFPTSNFPSYVSNGLMSYLVLFLTFFPGKFCFNFDTKLFLCKEVFWLWNIWKFDIEFNINVFSELTWAPHKCGHLLRCDT